MLRLLREREARHHTGTGRSAHYSDVQRGLLPPPVKIGPRASAWIDTEIDAVVRARAAGQSDDQIKALVRKLVAERAALAPVIG